MTACDFLDYVVIAGIVAGVGYLLVRWRRGPATA